LCNLGASGGALPCRVEIVGTVAIWRWSVARDGGQQQKSPRKQSEEDEAPQVESTGEVTERKEQLDDDVDAILDEIDEVLEENAEEFVRGFVQKGGQ
jgi:prokaryotic ubiquitin-like protein Pup